MERTSQAPVVAIPRARAAARWKRLDRDHLIGILMITPSVIAIGVFVYYFIGRTAYTSLVRWNDLKPD
jgi:ABC-type sugar transport system permease subunit